MTMNILKPGSTSDVCYLQVIIKIDIEGSELEVVPDLVFSGALRNTSKVFIEWHESFSNNRRKTQQMQTVIRDMEA